MRFIESPPVWSGDEAMNLWHTRVAQAVNENASLMGTATTTEGMGVTTRADGGAQVTNNLVIYPERYLRVIFAANADGSSPIADLSTFTGNSVFVGTRNASTVSAAETGTGAFFYQEFDWDGGNNNFYYNAVGGGRVVFDVQSTSPGSGFTEDTDPLTIDLEAGIAQGQDGLSVFPVYADSTTGANPSLTQGTREFIFLFRGVSQPTLPADITGETFTRFRGEDGASISATQTSGANPGDTSTLTIASTATGVADVVLTIQPGTAGTNGTDGSDAFGPSLAYTLQSADPTPDTAPEAHIFGGSLLRLALGDNTSYLSQVGANDLVRITVDTDNFIEATVSSATVSSNRVDFDLEKINTTGTVNNASGAVSIAFTVAAAGADGTSGADGIPGVSTTVQYNNRRSTAVQVAAAEQRYALLQTDQSVATEWSNVGTIMINDTDRTEIVRGGVVEDETHIRIFYDDNNWGFFNISSAPTIIQSNAVTSYTVTHVVSRGDITAALDSDVPVGIAWDIGVGMQGDAAITVDVSLSNNGVAQNSDGTYPVTTIAATAIWRAGSTDSISRNIGTITIGADGTASFSEEATAENPVTLGGTDYTPSITFDTSLRTITLITAGITDTATVLLGTRGEQGEMGMQGDAGRSGLTLDVYQRSSTNPATRPTEQAQFDVNTNTLLFNVMTPGTVESAILPVTQSATGNPIVQYTIVLPTGVGMNTVTGDESAAVGANADFTALGGFLSIAGVTNDSTLRSQLAIAFTATANAAFTAAGLTNIWTITADDAAGGIRFTSTAETNLPNVVVTEDSDPANRIALGTIVATDGAPGTSGFTGTVSNGWHTTVPTGDARLYRRSIRVVSTDDVFTVDADDWGETIQVTGADGATGLSVIEPKIYIRQEEVPTSLPTNNAQYVLATDSLMFEDVDNAQVESGYFVVEQTASATVIIQYTVTVATGIGNNTITVTQSDAVGADSRFISVGDFLQINGVAGSASNFRDALAFGIQTSLDAAFAAAGLTNIWNVFDSIANNRITFSTTIMQNLVNPVFTETGDPNNVFSVSAYVGTDGNPGTSNGFINAVSNGWSISVPSGTDTLWSRTFRLVSSAETRLITAPEWSNPVREEGTPGTSPFFAYANNVQASYPTTGIAIEDLGPQDHSVGNSYSWPTTAANVLGRTGFTYTPGQGSASNRDDARGSITNNSGSNFSLTNARLDVDIIINSLPADGTAALSVRITSGGLTVFSTSRRVINTEGLVTVSTIFATGTSWVDGDTFDISIFESIAADQGFNYTVQAVRISDSQTELMPNDLTASDISGFSTTSLVSSRYLGVFSGIERPTDIAEYAWSQFTGSGSPGETGDRGERGEAAPRSTELTVYLGPRTSAPTAPSATSINFSDRTVTGLSAGWQVDPIEVTVTNTSLLYYTSVLTFNETEFGGSQIVSASTPVASINFGDNIQSDNYVSGSAGWQIQRNTGNAEFSNVLIRGDSRVQGDAIVEGTLSVNALRADEIYSRNVQSPNFVAASPTVTNGPATSGYRLESNDGLIYAEEIRANVIGAITAPSSPGSSSLSTYVGTLSSANYLNVSSGTAATALVSPDGSTTSNMWISSFPMYNITLNGMINTPGITANGFNARTSGLSFTESFDFIFRNTGSSAITSTTPGALSAVYTGFVVRMYDSSGNQLGSTTALNNYNPTSAMFPVGSNIGSTTGGLPGTIEAGQAASTSFLVSNSTVAAVFNTGDVVARIEMYPAVQFDDNSATAPVSFTMGVLQDSNVELIISTSGGTSMPVQSLVQRTS